MKKSNEEERDDKFVNSVIKILVGYAVFIAFIILLFKYVFMISAIPSGSMENTVFPGDIVLSARLGINEVSIGRYDILTFTLPDEPSVLYIKRVIGLPGETVVVESGKVYVDGAEIDDSFIKGYQDCKGDGTYVVPEGCYFFLGDNRNNSRDSRFWEVKYVPLENIQAVAKLVVYPFSHIKGL